MAGCAGLGTVFGRPAAGPGKAGSGGLSGSGTIKGLPLMRRPFDCPGGRGVDKFQVDAQKFLKFSYLTPLPLTKSGFSAIINIGRSAFVGRIGQINLPSSLERAAF